MCMNYFRVASFQRGARACVCLGVCIFVWRRQAGWALLAIQQSWNISIPLPEGGGGVERRGGVRTRKARPEEEDDGHIKRAAAERSRKESEGNDNACWEVKELWGILMSHLVIQTFVKWKENIKFNYARKKRHKMHKNITATRCLLMCFLGYQPLGARSLLAFGQRQQGLTKALIVKTSSLLLLLHLWVELFCRN